MTFIRRKNSSSGIDSQGTEAGSSPSPLNRRYANFQTERLRFSLDRVTVVPHWKNHLFFSVFLLVGGGIMLLLLMQPEREIVPVIFTGIFALAGLGGMIAPYFARRPEIDLFSRSFYPRGRRSAAAFEQIPLERFRFLRILTKHYYFVGFFDSSHPNRCDVRRSAFN